MDGNTGLAFYKHYYRGINFSDIESADSEQKFKDKNEKLVDRQLMEYGDTINCNMDCTKELTTLYPGLLCGSGYTHQSKAKGEIKLGFHFDYTTGLPIISGSSIKGVLRSAFNHKGYVSSLLKEMKIEFDGEKECEIEKELCRQIFNYKEASIYKKDIFLDAFPIKSENFDNKYLGFDYITAHKNPLKNPDPIQFIKVLPRVKYRFKFILFDTKISTGNSELVITKDHKTELFTKIILDLGLGAKTNVGYGQFEDESNNNKENSSRKANEEEEREFVIGEIIDCYVSHISDEHYYFSFEGSKNNILKKKKKKIGNLDKGQNVKIKVLRPCKSISEIHFSIVS